VGAVAGFCNMVWKMVEEARGDEAPTHVAVIFDKSERTFRNELYPGYKAQRPPAPEDLVPQFPLIRDAVRAFNLPCIEMDGYEADDIIATYAEQAKARGGRVTIISADKDLMQLVGGPVSMVDTLKNRRIGPEEVVEKFGVEPDRVVDVQALAGDSIDNVPGAPGIGIKTAAQLIHEYGDLDALLARAGEIKQPKRRQTLIDHAAQILVSRELVTLKRDVDLPEPLEALEVREPDADALLGFLAQMEFRTLTGRIAQKLGREAPTVTLSSAAAAPTRSGDAPASPAHPALPPVDPRTWETVRDTEALASGSLASTSAAPLRSTPRRLGSTRWSATSSASRFPPGRVAPPTSLSATAAVPATFSTTARSFPVRSTARPASPCSSPFSRTRASSRSART
jgi:DNA polymerase I